MYRPNFPPTDTIVHAATRNRHCGLDALRGIAALMVVAGHAMEATLGYTDVFKPAQLVINPGRFGILVFFLISGFVIPPSLKRDGVRLFLVNRAFRLLPALWLSVACAAALRVAQGDGVTAADILANATMMASLLSMKPMFGCYWTLSVELAFYCACIALYTSGLLANHRLVGGVALYSAGMSAIMNLNLLGLPAYLLTGMLLRAVHDGDRSARPWAWAAVGALVAIAPAILLHAGAALQDQVRWFSATLLAVPVFLIVMQRGARKTAPVLQWLATASYSIYLFQDVALWSLDFLIPVAPVLYPIAVLAGSIAIGGLVARFIELPALAIGRRVARNLRQSGGREQAWRSAV